MDTNTPAPFSFKGIEWKKVGKGALIAVIGALLTYITQLVPQFNVPKDYLPLLTAGLAVLTNVVHKWAQE